MKPFIIADGVIQGILAVVCIICIPIICIPFLYRMVADANYPFYYVVWALFSWQLFSSLLHITNSNRLPVNKYLYAFQLILAGYSACIGLPLIIKAQLVVFHGINLFFYYLFYGGIFTLIPVLMISIAFLTVRRMFMPLPAAV